MHPIDTDLVARWRREDARRAAEQRRQLVTARTRPSLRARLGARLVAAGRRLQTPPRRRRHVRRRMA